MDNDRIDAMMYALLAQRAPYEQGRRDLEQYIGYDFANFVTFPPPVVYQGENVVDFAEYKAKKGLI